jgi:hypothetical protein
VRPWEICPKRGRARRCFEQSSNFLGAQHARQPARIMHARELRREVGAAERDSEKEAQHDGRTVHARRLHSGGGAARAYCSNASSMVRVKSLSGLVATGRDVLSFIALMITRLVPPLAGYPHSDRHVLAFELMN